MTLRDRLQLAAQRAGTPACASCGVRHAGAAWSPTLGWHDASSSIPASPFTRRAQSGTLPGKVVH